MSMPCKKAKNITVITLKQVAKIMKNLKLFGKWGSSDGIGISA